MTWCETLGNKGYKVDLFNNRWGSSSAFITFDLQQFLFAYVKEPTFILIY
ncbi:MAG: hypothetical protein L0H55_07995 [Candidatus Nitrosocosmicus sp.]|nr:hypothetical protein [Candidatus Nitrosocosmicus sp.]